jgi:hypothetical protein
MIPPEDAAALPQVLLAEEPPTVRLVEEPPAPWRVRWGALLGMLTFGAVALLLLIGVVAGVIWVVAEPVAKGLENMRLQAEQRERERQAMLPTPPAPPPAPRYSVEEILAKPGQPTHDQLAFLIEADQTYSQKATQAADAGNHAGALAAWTKLGEIRQRLREWRAAAYAYSQAYQMAMDLLDNDANDPVLRLQHVRLALLSAQCLHKGHQRTQAENLVQQAAILAKQGEEQFAGPGFSELYAQTQTLLAEVMWSQRREADALEQERIALQLWRSLATDHPQNHVYRAEQGRLLLAQGDQHARKGRGAQAQSCYREAEALLRPTVDRPQALPDHRLWLGFALLRQRKALEAVVAAQALEAETQPMELRFGLARIYAQVSVMDTMPEGQRSGFALGAVLLLHRLQWQDFFRDPADYRLLLEEPDLAPVRERDEFQKVRQDAKERLRPRPLVET